MTPHTAFIILYYDQIKSVATCIDQQKNVSATFWNMTATWLLQSKRNKMLNKVTPSVGASTAESKMNFLDLILKNQESEFENDKFPNKEKVITPSIFFEKENPGGPISKTDFLALAHKCTRTQLIHLDAFLGKISQGEKVDANPFESEDEDGRLYLWARFKYKNGSQNLKIYTAGQMCKFIQMYQMGLFKVDLSLESLYQEAKR